MARLLRSSAVFVLSVAVTSAGRNQPAPTYDVYAIRYATIADFPVRGLIAGADSSRRMDIAMTVWVLRGGGRTVLVDAGFYRDKFVQRWKPVDFALPSDAVGRVGIKAEDVTDIIVSHVHWDHLDGLDLFPNARIWIQKDEYQHHVGASGGQLDRAIDPDDAKMLAALAARGRVQQIDGDSVQIIPGITVFTGGKHTFASQYASVVTKSGTAVVASDNLYLYENLDTHRPIAQTLDSLSNLAAQERMMRLASVPRLIVPGHDPAVFIRFPAPGNGVAHIE
jgi:glyoxylase-like metal-dependent hydrolase (beta-lactamase superfamily II)